jgi:type IV secretory pathway VirB2 component (pilin)
MRRRKLKSPAKGLETRMASVKMLGKEFTRRRALLFCLAVVFFSAMPIYAQSSPWENAVRVLEQSFTGPIAKGLSLVAIVVGGLMFAFGEGDSKRMLAGIVFGIGMAIGAVAFMSWLFP